MVEQGFLQYYLNKPLSGHSVLFSSILDLKTFGAKILEIIYTPSNTRVAKILVPEAVPAAV